MNYKECLLLIILMLMSAGAKAQQDPMYSQYMFNTLAINPAYAGSRNVLSVTGLVRSQWIGIDGAPRTQTVSFDTPLRGRNIGIGFQAFNDQVGITRTTGAFASYAYRIIGQNGVLSFGLQAGLSNFRAQYSLVNLTSGGQGDPAFGQDVNAVLPNFGTGVYYNSERFYIGASVPHLLNNQLNNGEVTVTNGLVSRQYIHAFITAGYVVGLGPDYKVKPSVMFRAVRGAPLQADVGANFWIRDALAIGAQYRTGSDISAMLEAQISPQVRIGYAFDRSITKLINYNSGSHEIMLRYEFGFEKDKILAPRYF